MAFDDDGCISKLFEPTGVFLEDTLPSGSDSRLIVLKKQGLDLALFDGPLKIVQVRGDARADRGITVTRVLDVASPLEPVAVAV